MSDAVIHNGVVYLSGIVGRTGSDVIGQTQSALADIDRILEDSGTNKSHILSATIWLADMGDFEAMNAVWDKWVDADNPPARATGQVQLAREKYRIEIIVVAALPRED